jgi:hypothetical protein
MAPERLDGHAGGPAVDVYATAALAFEMLSGRKAVTGSTPIEVARRVMEAPPPDLTEELPGAPARAAEVLKRGLAKQPDERQATAGELVRELSGAYTEPARPAPRRPAPAAPPPVRLRSRPAWIVPAALAAVAAAIVAIVLVAGSGGGSDHKPAQARHAKQVRKKPRTRSAATSSSTAPAPAQAAPAQPAPAQPAAGGSPATAVTDFYTRAANDDFQGAWGLGTPRLHSQFGSLGTFQATFATLRSISLAGVRVTGQSGSSATVEFSSVAQHTDYVDRCSGQAAVMSEGGRWLVDHVDVSCARERGKPRKAKKPKKH